MGVKQLEQALVGVEIIELGQYLEEGMPVHPTHSRFYKECWHSVAFGDVCNDNQLILNEHNGTHVDSFGHYITIPGYEMIDEIPLHKLCGPCITIDATFLKSGESLEKDQIVDWEQKNERVRAGDIVLIDFGWMRYWALRPEEKTFCHGFPGLGASGAKYLRDLGIRMIGVDTLGLDKDGADNDPAHHIMLSARIPIAENLRNLNLIHGKRGFFVCLPLLIRGGSASPIRPVVLLDSETLDYSKA